MKMLLSTFTIPLTVMLTVVFVNCTEAKQIEAASGYEAQQMSCIDQYARRADIDACRARVKAAWSTVDAGSEGGDR